MKILAPMRLAASKGKHFNASKKICKVTDRYFIMLKTFQGLVLHPWQEKVKAFMTCIAQMNFKDGKVQLHAFGSCLHGLDAEL